MPNAIHTPITATLVLVASCAPATRNSNLDRTPIPETGPAPILIVHARGYGSATPLDDGTLVTTNHVFRFFPQTIAGKPWTSLDVIRRGLATEGPHTGTADQPSYLGDWVQLRIEPHVQPGWHTRDLPMRPAHGDQAIIDGFTAASGIENPPIRTRARARFVEAPEWVLPSERSLLFAEPLDSAETSGMSGSPVLIARPDGSEHLVGIFLGRISKTTPLSRTTRFVIQPWPPGE